MKKEKPVFKLPVILYDEPEYPGADPNPIPYIVTTKSDVMPPVLMIEEAYDTGEFEVGLGNKKEAIYEYVMHQYIDSKAIQNALSPEEFDWFRAKLGMKPLKESQSSGQQILDKVNAKVPELTEKAKAAAALKVQQNKVTV